MKKQDAYPLGILLGSSPRSVIARDELPRTSPAGGFVHPVTISEVPNESSQEYQAGAVPATVGWAGYAGGADKTQGSRECLNPTLWLLYTETTCFARKTTRFFASFLRAR